MDNKFYISTAIAYASATPHIGNVYEIVLADAVARFKRMIGCDVYFQTGTDEHGLKIATKASEAGMKPQEFVDGVSENIKRIFAAMNISYDRFIRTTEPKHKNQVQKIFKKLYEQGDIYKSEYEGMYCTPCESFFTESQLVDGKCPDCGREVKPAKEEAYFFRMSKYADRLMEHIESHPEFIQPPLRKNEMVNNFLKPGLQDLCVSRSTFQWGIPVSFDDKHVVYVWIDALSNYITLLGYETDGNHSEAYKKYWPADVHLVGKDILRFHTIYWPILLMALGQELPKQVFGHPWFLYGSDKMSKSKGNILYADDLIKLFGTDAVRYYLLREMPYAADGTITHELIMERINSELANILGNLVNRTIAMTHKYFDGVIPTPAAQQKPDDELIALACAAPAEFAGSMSSFHVADAIETVLTLLRRANKYIDETTPWILAKDEKDKPRLGTVLYHLLETIRIAAVLLSPVMPEAAETIFEQLHTDKKSWETVQSFGGLHAGETVSEPSILFERIDTVKKMKQIQAMNASKAAQKAAEEKTAGISMIGIDQFDQVSLRVAEILSCEPIPKADKLLKLTVKLGDEVRTVVSGIAKWYQPSDLIGKKVVMVANLKPVKLRGVESFGMILAADNHENNSVQVVFAPDVPSGSEIH